MSRWLYTGDDPAVFPTLTNPDGTTVFVEPGQVVELGEQEPAHRWLVPDDGTNSAPAGGSDTVAKQDADGEPDGSPDDTPTDNAEQEPTS